MRELHGEESGKIRRIGCTEFQQSIAFRASPIFFVRVYIELGTDFHFKHSDDEQILHKLFP